MTILVLTALLPAGASAQTTPARPEPLAAVHSWGYQLQNIAPDTIAASPYDMVVIDYSRDGSDDGALRPIEVRRMQAKPDGSRRIVLAYLSIGEAETYRFYWKRRWTWMSWPAWSWFWRFLGGSGLPAWLGPQNPEWQGNYGVRYWQPGWQEIIFLRPDSYLERIVRAGFDGVYLDKVDQFADMQRDRLQARDDMKAFVAALAARARAMDPGFLIVAQNGEELLADPTYRATIDGLGKEDLLYGEPKNHARNAPGLIEHNTRSLQLLTADRKPVFAVEYLRDPVSIEAARRELQSKGFIPHFADRDLESLRIGDVPTKPEGRRR